MTLVTYLRSSPLFSVDEDGRVHYHQQRVYRSLIFKISSRDAFIADRLGSPGYYEDGELRSRGDLSCPAMKDSLTTDPEYCKLLRELMTSTTPFYRGPTYFILYARYQLWILRGRLITVNIIPEQFASYIDYTLPLVVKIEKGIAVVYQTGCRCIIIVDVWKDLPAYYIIAFSPPYSIISAAPRHNYAQFVVRHETKKQNYFGIVRDKIMYRPINWWTCDEHQPYIFTDRALHYRHVNGTIVEVETQRLDANSPIPVKVYFF